MHLLGTRCVGLCCCLGPNDPAMYVNASTPTNVAGPPRYQHLLVRAPARGALMITPPDECFWLYFTVIRSFVLRYCSLLVISCLGAPCLTHCLPPLLLFSYDFSCVCDPSATNHRLRPFYAFRLSSKLGFFMTDNRVERSLHR